MATAQTWMIAGRLYGPFPISPELTHAQVHAPRSYAWACPHCGEVWARRIISPSPRWFFWTVCCEKCKEKNDNSLTTPGSIWVSENRDYLDNLPVPIIQYECQLQCRTGAIPSQAYNSRR